MVFIFLILVSCEKTIKSLKGTWVSYTSEIILEGKVKRIGGFDNNSEKKIIFTEDSMYVMKSNGSLKGSINYQTRNDTIFLADGIEFFIYNITEDTLRLIPILNNNSNTVTRVLIRE